MSFTQEYFKLGYQLQKQAGQEASTLFGALGPNPMSWLGTYFSAEEGKEKETIAKALLGQLVGSAGGGLVGGLGGAAAAYLGGNTPVLPAAYGGASLGALLGSMGGGGIGAYLGHGPNKEK